MPATYVPDPTATQAPASQPDPDNFPSLSLPIAGDGATAASVAQAFKALGDAIAWLKKPRAKGSSWTQEVRAYMNSRLHRRGGFNHQGMPGGLIQVIDEDWSNVALTQKTANVAIGPWGGRWNIEIATTGGAIAGFTQITGPQADGGNNPIGPRCALLDMNPQAVTSQFGVVLVEHGVSIGRTCVDSYFEMEWQMSAGGASFMGGLAAASQSGVTVESTGFIGAGIGWRVGDANLKAYTKTDSGAAVFTDTGVVLAGISNPLRCRLEIIGANESDDTNARCIFYANGAVVSNVVTDIGKVGLLPFFRVRNADTPGHARIGTVKVRANLNPGDLFI